VTSVTRTLEPEPHGEADEQTPADASDDRPDAVSVTQKIGRTHSAATPYLQYLTKLVQRVFLTPDRLGDPIRSVAFASVNPQKGCAFLPAAAAELLASRVSGRVCLVDADFQKPSLHHCYDVSNEIGLVDALRGTGPVRSYARRLIQGHQSSLWLLPSGASERGGRVLTTDEEHARIRDLIAAFDYVLIAAPCVTQHHAATTLGAQVDGVVMTVEAHVTKRRSVRACADAVRASGGRVLGTVLNNRTFPIPEAVYRLL
jgi:Mrp family chromosome partitioning ATPase